MCDPLYQLEFHLRGTWDTHRIHQSSLSFCNNSADNRLPTVSHTVVNTADTTTAWGTLILKPCPDPGLNQETYKSALTWIYRQAQFEDRKPDPANRNGPSWRCKPAVPWSQLALQWYWSWHGEEVKVNVLSIDQHRGFYLTPHRHYTITPSGTVCTPPACATTDGST